MSPYNLPFLCITLSSALGAHAHQLRWSSSEVRQALRSAGAGLDDSVQWLERSLEPEFAKTEQVHNPAPVESVQNDVKTQPLVVDDGAVLQEEALDEMNIHPAGKHVSPLDFFLNWLQAIFHMNKSTAQLSTNASSDIYVPFDSFVWEPVDCAYPSVSGLVLEMRVKKFEDASFKLLLEAISPTCDPKNVTNALAYADHLSDSIKECQIIGKEILASRVQTITLDLASASRHKNSLALGSEDSESLYTASDETDFAPNTNCSATEAADWYIAKVAGAESMTQHAIDSKQGLDEAYHFSHRLSLSMIRVLSLRDTMGAKDVGTMYSQKVIQVLRLRLDELQELLRIKGAHPGTITGGMSDPATQVSEPANDLAAQASGAFDPIDVSFDSWTPVNCTQPAEADVIIGERVEELEDKSLISMLAAICSSCDHKSVDDTFTLLRHLRDALRICALPDQKALLGRINNVEMELVRASHHKDLVAGGKDPNGLYAFDDSMAFAPKAGTSPTKAAQFFIGKVASLDAMMREAVQNGNGLDEAYHYAHRIGKSMARFLSHRSNLLRNTFEVKRARSVVEALQSHMQKVQKVLRSNGAQPGAHGPSVSVSDNIDA